MLNILSLLIGVVALFLVIFAFLPFLGWANWLIVPLALVGLAFGQLSSSRSGRNLNLVVIVIGIVRLSLGGGII
jgi:TRAP-type mannitol/chloroaromatic compound transport system permease small subunit